MGHYIISPQEMYEAERAVFATGRASFSLMQQAGMAVADLLHRDYPTGTIRVLCGPGGNGGDGFVAATRLASLGRQVSVFLLGAVDALKGDPKAAAERWPGPIEDLSCALEFPADITVDALFGGGLSRSLEGTCAKLAEATHAPVVSVDVPSGLDGLTGQPLGACFHASLTVTFAALRPAHVLFPGKALCGRVEVVDIDVPVPTHSVYEEFGPNLTLETSVFDTAEECERACGGIDPVCDNDIELVRRAAGQLGCPVLINRPHRLLGRPSGSVHVDAG